jgi:hypothetical protein
MDWRHVTVRTYLLPIRDFLFWQNCSCSWIFWTHEYKCWVNIWITFYNWPTHHHVTVTDQPTAQPSGSRIWRFKSANTKLCHHLTHSWAICMCHPPSQTLSLRSLLLPSPFQSFWFTTGNFLEGSPTKTLAAFVVSLIQSKCPAHYNTLHFTTIMVKGWSL